MPQRIIGSRNWAIPEGFIPPGSSGPKEMESHETACILNANKEEARILITVYFSDQDPVGPYEITVPAERTLHLRLNELKKPREIPPGKDYATVYESSVPVVIQHTRLDSRQAENALLSTMAYSA